MSYYVPEHSIDCFEHLVSLYDFQNYDYGDKELNDFAKTLKNDWFMSITKKWHRAFSDFITFEIGGKHECTLNHYVFSKENKEGFQLVIKDNKYKFIQTDEKGYAEYIYAYVLTPERLIPRLAKLLEDKKIKHDEQEAKYQEYLRQQDEWDYKHNPARWTPEKRIEKYIEYLHTWIHDDRAYSDDYRVYQEYNAFMDRFHKLKKALSPEEMEEAHSLYREIYNEEPSK